MLAEPLHALCLGRRSSHKKCPVDFLDIAALLIPDAAAIDRGSGGPTDLIMVYQQEDKGGHALLPKVIFDDGKARVISAAQWSDTDYANTLQCSHSRKENLQEIASGDIPSVWQARSDTRDAQETKLEVEARELRIAFVKAIGAESERGGESIMFGCLNYSKRAVLRVNDELRAKGYKTELLNSKYAGDFEYPTLKCSWAHESDPVKRLGEALSRLF